MANFTVHHNIYSDDASVLFQTFMEEFCSTNNDCSRAVAEIESIGTYRSVTELVKAQVGLQVVRTVPCQYGYTVIEFQQNGVPVLITKVHSETNKPYEERKRLSNVILVGNPELVEEIHKALETGFPQNKAAKASWYFRNNKGETTNMVVQLQHRDAPKDEFYPWIEGGISGFCDRFLDDDANILLLTGEPGTGKTTFIRELIHRYNLDTAITHDSHLMDMDEFFISFMTGDHQLLVLEDADILLHARENGNHVMSKLLNTSDGLIRTNKKVILTANITQIDRVDTALIRPGRCFATLNFRELTVKEAAAAALAAGVEPPSTSATLATLFKGHNAHVASTPRVGFGVSSKVTAASSERLTPDDTSL